jgi:hypothetical protein
MPSSSNDNAVTSTLSGILAWWRSRDSPELRLLLIAMLFLAGTWAFAVIASEVREGESQGLDELMLRALRDPTDVTRPRGPTWLTLSLLLFYLPSAVSPYFLSGLVWQPCCSPQAVAG